MEDDAPDPFNERFEFPSRILDQISESSPEGFLLFIINEEGQVEMFTKENSAEIIETGLRMKALKVLSSLNALEDNQIMEQIFQQSRAHDVQQNPNPNTEETEEIEEDGDEELPQ